MKATLSFRQSLIEKALSIVWQQLPITLSSTQKKMLLISILLTNVLISSFAQKTNVLLSRYDSCHVKPPQQTKFVTEAVGMAPMVRVAYVIPSNRTPQPNGVANLQNAIKLGRQFFQEQMEQNGFGPKTFIFETEEDGVTPLIHVVNVAETDSYLREDLWGRAQAAASNAGISLWAPGEVWVVIPETHVMFPDGSGAGGVALGSGWGSGNGGGVSMIGSNALPLFHPAMITDDTPYDGKVIPELGPYPMKQDVTFAWFEGTTYSSVASSWLGALWHETGHAFGLGHDFRNDNNFHGNLMGNGLRGTRGTLFPEKYPQDYTRLEYWTALFLNVSHFFNSDKIVTNSPTVSHGIQGSVTPQQGLVHLPFQASDPDGLSFAYLVLGGDMAAEMLLDGTTADTTFAVPYFTQGNTNGYTIFVVDTQGNKTAASVQFNVPAGHNQAPFPFIKLTPPVPGENQPVTLDATQSSDVDHDQSSLLATWDVDNDGQFDTEPSTNKTLQYHYQNPGNYLIRVKLTDPAGAQTISTAVSIKIPGEKKIAVESFTLIDADNDESVSELQDGLIIKQTEWEGKKFSVRANTSSGMIDRVEFNLMGPIVHEQIDLEPPYALFGDSPSGNFIGRELLQGEYTLTATPFYGSEKGNALTVSFRVIPRPPSIVRDKTLGGMGTEWLRSLAATSDGGFLLGGRSNSNASGDKSENGRGEDDFWIIKVDSQFNKEWDKTYGGDRSEDLHSIVPSPDGGYLLGGISGSDISGDKTDPSRGSGDYWVVKIDNEGNKIWDRTFGGDGYDILLSMVPSSDGGYLLAGSSASDISGDKSDPSKGFLDYWVVKIDSQGNKIWDKTFGGGFIDGLQSVTATVDGYLLGGYSGFETSVWVVKIDSQGNKIWDKTFGGDGNLFASVISVPDGGFLLTGAISSPSGSSDFWVVKIDADGNRAWDKAFGGNRNDMATAAVAAPGGGYLLSGRSNSDMSGDKSENRIGEDVDAHDYWAVKIDAQGNKEWDKTLGGSDNDDYPNAILTPAGGYLLAGYSRSNASGDKSEDSKGDYDYWIVELKFPSAPAVTSLTLMNAHTDEEIKELKNGDVINLTEVGTSLLDIRANINAENINKVTFDLSGPITHHQTELLAPYALFGDIQANFNGRKLLPGEYTLTVTPYINEKEGAPVSISFSVTNGITLTLMNAHTDQEIMELEDGDSVRLTEVGTRLLDVRANISGEKINKVVFDLKGPVTHYQIERVVPYALFGDNQYDFNGRKLLPGAYTLTVMPYANDIKVTEHRISFTVTDGFEITGFTLIDATLDKPVGALSEGDVIDLSLFNGHKLGVRADSYPTHLDKVDLSLKGPIMYSNTERVYPYVLFGDITQNGSTDYTGAKMFPGTYTLTATPYAGGVRGTPHTITFEVIRGGEAACRQVEVYPVPASDVINVRHEGKTDQAYMILLDVDGNVLLQRPLSRQPVEQLDVSAFQKGVHYLKVVSPEGMRIVRLVIE